MYQKGTNASRITISLCIFWKLLFLLVCCFIVRVDLVAKGESARDSLLRLARTQNKPEQIHLAFGSNPKDVVLLWSSSSDEKSFVEFSSNDPSKAIKRVASVSVELTDHSENAKKFIHRAELENLELGTQYSYRISSGPSGEKSELFTFNVPDHDPKKSQNFMVLADMGLATKSLHFVVNEAVNGKYDAVFHIGDLAYNLDADGGSVGDKFMKAIQQFTSVVPYMTTPGDHERFYDYYHYRHRFSMPNAKWPMKEKELWYSIDIGLVHFISINTDALLNYKGYKDKQLAWLTNDLVKANSNRQKVPWLIVMGHKPMYCTKSVMEQECDKEFSGLRLSLEDLFFEYGVDMFISGHKHCYERTWPMYKGKVFEKSNIDPTAPIYLVIGALGYEYLLDTQMSKPYWLAASMSKEGKELFGRLKVVNATHLVWSVHVASTNEEVDNIQLVQRHHGSFGAPGQVALDKLRERQSGTKLEIPVEPLTIIDEPAKNVFYYAGVSRKVVLLSCIFALSFFLLLFLRHSKVRKTLGFW